MRTPDAELLEKHGFYAIRQNVNTREFYWFNVFSHPSYAKSVAEAARTYKTRPALKERVLSISRYYYWARCEYEFVATPWPPSPNSDEGRKYDVYSFIEANIESLLDVLVSMFWEGKRRPSSTEKHKKTVNIPTVDKNEIPTW